MHNSRIYYNTEKEIEIVNKITEELIQIAEIKKVTVNKHFKESNQLLANIELYENKELSGYTIKNKSKYITDVRIRKPLHLK